MNPLPNKNEWGNVNSALPANPGGKTDQKRAEPSLSGTQTQPLPRVSAASQFGSKLVQFAVKPLAERDNRSPALSKKVRAAMEGDPDPAAALAGIRNLLVGPTRNLHDAMFEEVVTILEESDREVQQGLRSLGRKFESLSHVTDELISSSVESRDEIHRQSEFFNTELEKTAAAQQAMLSEMFLAIDSKIEEMTKQVNRRIEDLAEKIASDMREAAAQREQKLQDLEAMCLTKNNKVVEDLEARLNQLEHRANSEKDDLSEAFAGGLSNIADRLKALRQN